MAAESTPEEEVRRLERHYSVNPEGLVFARLADAYRRCGRLERSLDLLRDGLERHPDYTTGHLIRARTLREADRSREAADSFRRVLELDAENLVALRSLAELAAERGDVDEAHRWADRLQQADPFASFSVGDVEARARATGESSRDGVDAARGAEAPEPPAAAARGPGAEPSGASGPTRDPPDPPGPGADPPSGDGDGELPGEEDLASEIAAMADEQWWSSAGEAGDEAAAGDEEPDVATETMAHLYAQQGLYEEAAEVYRRLLERRPGDEELRRRLEEVAGRVDGGVQVPAEPDARDGTDARGGTDGAEARGGTDAPDEVDAPHRASEEEAGEPAAEPAADGREESRSGVSAREHFRALLRGRARGRRELPGEGGGRPDADTARGGRHAAAGEAAG